MRSHEFLKEESASDINPNTGNPYTSEEWARYWNPGAGRPYTEKEKEMFGKPEDGPKNLGRFILSRTPVIGDIMAIGDAIKSFKDLSR